MIKMNSCFNFFVACLIPYECPCKTLLNKNFPLPPHYSFFKTLHHHYLNHSSPAKNVDVIYGRPQS